jgi:hypothetical protein
MTTDITTTTPRNRFIAGLRQLADDLAERPTLDHPYQVSTFDYSQQGAGFHGVIASYMVHAPVDARNIMACFDGEWAENSPEKDPTYLAAVNDRGAYRVKFIIERKLMLTEPPVYPGLAELVAGGELEEAVGEVVEDEGDATDHDADVAKEDADDVTYGDE